MWGCDSRGIRGHGNCSIPYEREPIFVDGYKSNSHKN